MIWLFGFQCTPQWWQRLHPTTDLSDWHGRWRHMSKTGEGEEDGLIPAAHRLWETNTYRYGFAVRMSCVCGIDNTDMAPLWPPSYHLLWLGHASRSACLPPRLLTHSTCQKIRQMPLIPQLQPDPPTPAPHSISAPHPVDQTRRPWPPQSFFLPCLC